MTIHTRRFMRDARQRINASLRQRTPASRSGYLKLLRWGWPACVSRAVSKARAPHRESARRPPPHQPPATTVYFSSSFSLRLIPELARNLGEHIAVHPLDPASTPSGVAPRFG
jgi:hypothetical protein